MEVVEIVWKKHGNNIEVGNNMEIIWKSYWKLEISYLGNLPELATVGLNLFIL